MLHVGKIFDSYVEENLKLKLSNCNFVKTKTNFFLYEVSNSYITPDISNIETRKKLKVPTNVKELLKLKSVLIEKPILRLCDSMFPCHLFVDIKVCYVLSNRQMKIIVCDFQQCYTTKLLRKNKMLHSAFSIHKSEFLRWPMVNEPNHR